MLYKLFRDTHLLFGLFCCLFLLMYGVSAVQMAHNKWFNLRPDVTTVDVTLPAQQADARAVARELMEGSGLSGDLSGVHAAPENLSFNIVRPGTVDQVTYSLATGETMIRENRAGFMGMMNRLHHAAGFAGTYWWDNPWGVFIAIVSAGLFVMGITGIYLWFRIHTERVMGAILLILSLGYSLTLLVLIRTAH
ncbi:MAG TPA: PepSY-associated TM helix domain-containing protein [Candidatus Acidoferrales bacterium]|nr:PepSY-associated TM helix domain-containing protein [Candidatus Acidoferrales bacterium]